MSFSLLLKLKLAKTKWRGFFSRLVKGLLKTKQNIGAGFRGFFLGKKIDDELFEELEEQLLIADIGVPTTSKIIKIWLNTQAAKNYKMPSFYINN